MAVKVAEEEAATTVTEGGTVSRALLLASATTIPPFDAPPLNATVQVVLAPAFRLVGLHVRDDSITGATRLTVAVCKAPFRLAVRVAL